MGGNIIAGFSIFILFVSQSFLGERLWNRFQALPQPSFTAVEKWNPEVFRSLQFGHVQTAVDWLLIRFLVESAHLKAQGKGERHSSFYDLDLATDLDPAFFELYWAGANYLAVVFSDGVSARDLLTKGNRFRTGKLAEYPASFQKRYWGAEWAVPLLLAYVNLFELENMPAASRAFREAAQVPGAPPYLLSLQKRFEKPGGEYEVGIRLLNFMIESAPSVEARQKLESRRQSLFVGQFIHQVNLEFAAFLGTHPKHQGMERLFNQFLKQKSIGRVDPWGGRLQLNTEGRIQTTTPHEKVYGLD